MSDGFASTIKAERQRQKASQAAFADLIGCSVSSLKRWESGQTIPPSVQRERVLFAIQCPGAVDVPNSGFHAGWWLRIARGQARRSIREAAQLAQISSSSWHRYESGEAQIGPKHAEHLATIAGAGLVDLAESQKQARPVWQSWQAHLATNPRRGVQLLVREFFEGQLLPRTEAWCLAHEALGMLLVGTGEYDLAGQAFAEALAARPKKGTHCGLDPTSLRLSSAWRGFQLTEPAIASLRRHQWMEAQLERAPKSLRDAYCLPRTIFANRAGNTAAAHDMIMQSPGCKEHLIMEAWQHAQYGDPKRALGITDKLLADPDVNSRFSAHKTALVASSFQGDKATALHHYGLLKKMESGFGLRLMGIRSETLRIIQGTE